MTEIPITTKKYDLEERTLGFAKKVSLFCTTLPRTISNLEYQKQLIRSGSSIGANYIEANEALGKKDFLFHVRISRKEAKESVYWLRLVLSTNHLSFVEKGLWLVNEATELKKIFSAIITKSS